MAGTRLIHIARKNERACCRIVDFGAVQGPGGIDAAAHEYFSICQENSADRISRLRHAACCRERAASRVVQFRDGQGVARAVRATDQEHLTVREQDAGVRGTPVGSSQVSGRGNGTSDGVVDLGGVQNVATRICPASYQHFAVPEQNLGV